jgi:hypothetical protein
MCSPSDRQEFRRNSIRVPKYKLHEPEAAEHYGSHNEGELEHVPLTSCHLARKIRDFRNTEGLAMVQIRYLGGFETKNEAFA